ncbi:hypothetical protein J6590_038864 [Homalodisca vitripennis]|nr:hypothetical protein J6590_038864 [Homalodisca vitripennis]
MELVETAAVHTHTHTRPRVIHYPGLIEAAHCAGRSDCQSVSRRGATRLFSALQGTARLINCSLYKPPIDVLLKEFNMGNITVPVPADCFDVASPQWWSFPNLTMFILEIEAVQKQIQLVPLLVKSFLVPKRERHISKEKSNYSVFVASKGVAITVNDPDTPLLSAFGRGFRVRFLSGRDIYRVLYNVRGVNALSLHSRRTTDTINKAQPRQVVCTPPHPVLHYLYCARLGFSIYAGSCRIVLIHFIFASVYLNDTRIHQRLGAAGAHKNITDSHLCGGREEGHFRPSVYLSVCLASINANLSPTHPQPAIYMAVGYWPGVFPIGTFSTLHHVTVHKEVNFNFGTTRSLSTAALKFRGRIRTDLARDCLKILSAVKPNLSNSRDIVRKSIYTSHGAADGSIRRSIANQHGSTVPHTTNYLKAVNVNDSLKKRVNTSIAPHPLTHERPEELRYKWRFQRDCQVMVMAALCGPADKDVSAGGWRVGRSPEPRPVSCEAWRLIKLVNRYTAVHSPSPPDLLF